MAVTPKRKSGAAAASVKPPQLRSLPQTTREPRRGSDSSYETARIHEIENRSALYHLRLERIRAGLLDRCEVEREYGLFVCEIRRIIADSRLTRSEKREVYANLLTVGQFVENVLQGQKPSSTRADESSVINNGIDQEF